MSGSPLLFDCIVVGAGPGGLQAALHLARYNRRVLVLDRGGGRTRHARHIVNYLGLPEVAGTELVATGLAQVERFGVQVERLAVDAVEKTGGVFLVQAGGRRYEAAFLVASSGARENLGGIKNLAPFFGRQVYTCVDCDGHRTTGKKLLVYGNAPAAARLAMGMRLMYTSEVTLLLTTRCLPADMVELLGEDGISLLYGEIAELSGSSVLEDVLLADGRRLGCQALMLSLGHTLNDDYLAGLQPARDAEGFKITVNAAGETSVAGLYAVGALRQGHAQAVIAAGQGAVAAIDINGRLLGL